MTQLENNPWSPTFEAHALLLQHPGSKASGKHTATSRQGIEKKIWQNGTDRKEKPAVRRIGGATSFTVLWVEQGQGQGDWGVV